jgi:hypothetical protein
MNFKQIIVLLLIPLYFSSSISKAQSNQSSWPCVPGFGPESPVSLTNQETFFGVIGAAAISAALAEFVFKNNEKIQYYQNRIGMNNEHFWGYKKVFHQNFGFESRLAPWFAIAAEANWQQWIDQNPGIESSNSQGAGMGIMSYYRWYLFGKKRISPYLEYGAGLFYGFNEFPSNGTHFTFNLSTQLGLEYTFKNQNKLRLSYGQFHQSNNGLYELNPGYDGNGFSITYSWFWKKR